MKRKTAWHDDDFIFFELRSPEFAAFEFMDKGGSYSVADFKPGTYRLPFEAICDATGDDRRHRRAQLISVDMCQMFFVDKSCLAKFRKLLDPKDGA